VKIAAHDLTDRQIRGLAMAKEVAAGERRRMVVDKDDGDGEETVAYWSTRRPDVAHLVTRKVRSRRGRPLAPEYRSSDPDFKKFGVEDSALIACEKFVRGEVVVVGEVDRERWEHAIARRRPLRNPTVWNGLRKRTAQRHARVAMPTRVPELITSLKKAVQRGEKLAPRKRGGVMARDAERAATLVHKVSLGVGADELQAVLEGLVDSGDLAFRKSPRLGRKVPNQNTISRWMNDPSLTPTLMRMFRMVAEKVRRREVAIIADATKLSQMRTAHSRGVEYLGDLRPQAHWMKAHVVIGVETKMPLAVIFSDSRSSDVNYIVPLVEAALEMVPVKYVLADKAYLSGPHYQKLKNLGVQAVIPIKKGWGKDENSEFYETCKDLIEWFTERNRDFHEIYRFRPLIESFFSHLKNVADGFCWSQGMRLPVPDDEPITAWINEALCKIIYLALRTTVSLKAQTGTTIDYLFPDRCFPEAADPLVSAA